MSGAKSTSVGGGPDLRAMGPEDLAHFVESLGEPPYRARQLVRWIHQRGARSFEEMTDLSKALRSTLHGAATLGSMSLSKLETSSDGTRKYAFRTAMGDVVESVLIPDASAEGRNSLCISSQVGCAIDCKFCLTASLGLVRNLSSGEIVEQITRVKEDLGTVGLSQAETPEEKRIGNIVLMGMGEPLQNYPALIEALAIVSSKEGHQISQRRITVSTAGLASRIPALGRDSNVNLAVSLNATTDEVRDEIMPINRKWNIATLLDACRHFPLQERRLITIEYVLLAGINDSDADARRLVKLVANLRAKVNLIPFNEHPFSRYRRPQEERTRRFQEIVGASGIMVLVRTPRGDDISAACGQLGALVEGPRTRLPVIHG